VQKPASRRRKGSTSVAGGLEPRLAAGRVLDELRRIGDPKRAAGAAAYFKAYEKLAFFGVDAPTIRRMAARIAGNEGRAWQLADAVAFAECLLAERESEAKGVGICVLGRYRALFSPALFARARTWLVRSCTDWASCDGLCGEVLGPLLAAHPALVARLRAWRTARHLYVRRASAVALVPLARHGEALEDAYGAARVLGAEDHHLLQKAAGWLLREAGKTDAARLERFLRREGHALGRTTIRYAIERVAPGTRRELMVTTRSPR
jgi:3-methyladenine DNA glycosylase AlkD